MEDSPSPSSLSGAVPDSSLVAKWYTSSEAGWEHARRFQTSLAAGRLRLTAPAHMKVEVIRLLQLGVRDKRQAVQRRRRDWPCACFQRVATRLRPQ